MKKEKSLKEKAEIKRLIESPWKWLASTKEEAQEIKTRALIMSVNIYTA